MGRILDEFKVVERYLERGIKRKGRSIIFEENRWDDFLFRTTFEVYYHENDEYPKKIGVVQIANIDKTRNKRSMEVYSTIDDIPRNFTSLESDYISLGNAEYYKNLYNIFKNEASTILEELNDLAYNQSLYQEYKDEDVVEISFLRNKDMESSFLEELQKLAREGIRFSYDFNLTYEEASELIFSLNFKTDDDSLLPTNMHALIGNNGTGKTTLLQDLLNASIGKESVVPSFFSTDQEMTFSIKDNQAPDGYPQSISYYFKKVIYVSYSIFDTLRELNINNDQNIELVIVGKDMEDKENASDKFKEYLEKLVFSRESFKLFDQVISSLNMYRKPLYEEYGDKIDDMDEKEKNRYIEDIMSLYKEKSSSGQRIVLNTLSALISEIEPKSLIIFDEPELHLHPPLLSNFIRSISEILTEKNGLGIMATHSPVVLQEITRDNVYILENTEEFISARRPTKETFGENISTLMNTVFELDIKESGFYNLIKDLIESGKHMEKLDEIELGRDADLYKRLLLLKQDNSGLERDDS